MELNYNSKKHVTIEEQVDDIMDYAAKLNTYYFLKHLENERKKDLCYNYLGVIYILALVFEVGLFIKNSKSNSDICIKYSIITIFTLFMFTLTIALITKMISDNTQLELKNLIYNYCAVKFNRNAYYFNDEIENMELNQYVYFIKNVIKYIENNAIFSLDSDFANKLFDELDKDK